MISVDGRSTAATLDFADPGPADSDTGWTQEASR